MGPLGVHDAHTVGGAAEGVLSYLFIRGRHDGDVLSVGQHGPGVKCGLLYLGEDQHGGLTGHRVISRNVSGLPPNGRKPIRGKPISRIRLVIALGAA